MVNWNNSYETLWPSFYGGHHCLNLKPRVPSAYVNSDGKLRFGSISVQNLPLIILKNHGYKMKRKFRFLVCLTICSLYSFTLAPSYLKIKCSFFLYFTRLQVNIKTFIDFDCMCVNWMLYKIKHVIEIYTFLF